MEEKEGAFKIDLSASDVNEEKISNIVPPKKINGAKIAIADAPPAKNPAALLTAIGLVLLAVLFAAGYYSLWNAIKTINISGAEEIAGLSKELNEKIAMVNDLIEQQKKSLKEDISGVSAKIKTMESNLAVVTKAEKTNRSELQSALEAIQKELDPLKKQTNDIKQQADKIAGKTEEVSSSMTKVQSAIQKNQQDIERMSAAAVDAAKLESALKKERDANKQTINALANDISTLKKAVKDLEDRVSRLKNTSTALPAPSTGSSSNNKAPSTSAPSSKPGGIIEEEIY
jgi:chromosome segregation ATPase